MRVSHSRGAASDGRKTGISEGMCELLDAIPRSNVLAAVLSIPRSTLHRTKKGPVRPAIHHTLTEYGAEVTASAAAFRSVNESFGGRLPYINPSSIRYPIPTRETGNALVIPVGLECRHRTRRCWVRSRSGTLCTPPPSQRDVRLDRPPPRRTLRAVLTSDEDSGHELAAAPIQRTTDSRGRDEPAAPGPTA
ncbi:hypothetical protein EVAR_51728_1 [Eumeta japonica]|uniref:Uncharacterized protein n=1 Tax=Eumeta variegata TaxID=151549 RepID=A0A4C1XFX6_EUMVA|nr:hypothetical protein EVAR_51728_1 [Eumeta japonica]